MILIKLVFTSFFFGVKGFLSTIRERFLLKKVKNNGHGKSGMYVSRLTWLLPCQHFVNGFLSFTRQQQKHNTLLVTTH